MSVNIVGRRIPVSVTSLMLSLGFGRPLAVAAGIGLLASLVNLVIPGRQAHAEVEHASNVVEAPALSDRSADPNVEVDAAKLGRTAVPADDARCKTEFLEVPIGGDACGISFTADRLILLDGKELTKMMQRWKQEPAASQRLVLFPASESGRYLVINTCSHECREMLLIDRKQRAAWQFNAGNYGPKEWLLWSQNEGHAVLTSSDEGMNLLHIVRTKDALVYRTPWAVYSEASFAWLSPLRFDVSVGECLGEFCEDTRDRNVLTRVTFELTDLGLEVESIDDVSSTPIELQNAFLERRIVRDEGADAVPEGHADAVPEKVAAEDELRLELKDGTILTGAIQSAQIPFKSSFGQMEIDVEEVEGFADERLRLADGNVLKGLFVKGKIAVATNRGTFDVKTEDIVGVAREQGLGGTSGRSKAAPVAGQGVLSGRILDNFGQPVTGASIQITGSAFAAETDGDGHYEIVYVPGPILVQVKRDGYDPLTIELVLLQASTYPVEDQVMHKIPPRGAVSFQDRRGWSELGRCLVWQTQSDDMDLRHVGEERYVARGTPLLIVGEEAPAFIDDTGVQEIVNGDGLALYPVASDGTMISVQRSAGLTGAWGALSGSNQTTPPVSMHRHELGSGRSVYQSELQPGLYAFVSAVLGVPFPGSVAEHSCFMFEIKTREQILSEQQKRAAIARELEDAQSTWSGLIASSVSTWSLDDWDSLQAAAIKIHDLQQNPLVPFTVVDSPMPEAAAVATQFAIEALESNRLEDALLWSDRALGLNKTGNPPALPG